MAGLFSCFLIFDTPFSFSTSFPDCCSQVFVIPTDENNRASASPLDLASAATANVLDYARAQPLEVLSSQSGKRRRKWLDITKNDHPRQRKLFSEDRACHPGAVIALPIAMGPSFGAIADPILHDHISPLRRSPASLDAPRDVNCAPAAAHRDSRLTATPSSAPEPFADRPPPMSSVFTIFSRPLVVRLFRSRLSGGLRMSGPSPSSHFPSSSEYLSKFSIGWMANASPPF